MAEDVLTWEAGSTWYRVRGDLRAAAAPLEVLLAHLGIAGRYHVLGQSWGGMLAMEHAVRRPAPPTTRSTARR